MADRLPDHEDILHLVAERTPVRITFVGGERMPDLPASGILERVVFVASRPELGGLVLTADRPDGEPWSFWTGSEGGFHPRLTSIEACSLDLAPPTCPRCGRPTHAVAPSQRGEPAAGDAWSECWKSFRRRFTFAGLLGQHVEVDHGPTWSPDGGIVWQVLITLRVPALDGGGEGKLTEAWTVPADSTEDDIAEGVISRALTLLAHEALEAMRWNGEPVFDAHPSSPEAANEGRPRSGASSISEARALRPWSPKEPANV